MYASSHLQEWIDQFTKGDNAITGIVETSGCDTLFMYKLYLKEYDDMSGTRGGPVVTVGTIGDRPICIALNVVVICGKRLMFYDPTSQLVDHAMIEEYLDKTWPGVSRTDAMNVHNLVRG